MGKHFLLDLFGIDSLLLCEMEAFMEFVTSELNDCMAVILDTSSHKFENTGGYTFLVLLSTSHFSIHTWPENKCCAIDMFSCGEIMSDVFTSRVIQYFSPTSYNLKMLQR
ncbi:MAG: Cyanophage [Pseudomonadota bacterium]|jgi:S-adenosylmethionine decarboxylase